MQQSRGNECPDEQLSVYCTQHLKNENIAYKVFCGSEWMKPLGFILILINYIYLTK